MTESQFDHDLAVPRLRDLADKVGPHRLDQATQLLRGVASCPSWCIHRHDDSDEYPWYTHDGDAHAIEQASGVGKPLEVALAYWTSDHPKPGVTVHGEVLLATAQVRELAALLTQLADELESAESEG